LRDDLHPRADAGRTRPDPHEAKIAVLKCFEYPSEQSGSPRAEVLMNLSSTPASVSVYDDRPIDKYLRGGCMASSPTFVREVPAALHRSESELPFVAYQEGVTFQLLQADVEAGQWVVRVRLQPGATIQRHKHTGEVFAFTIKGAWKYLEYPEVNTAGSYLFEPAGSVHTLHALKSNDGVTDAWFAIRGANLNLNDNGDVESVLDAGAALEIYVARCREEGHPPPNVIGM
jgi:quercetin dioxygenase-like cupin family protein